MSKTGEQMRALNPEPEAEALRSALKAVEDQGTPQVAMTDELTNMALKVAQATGKNFLFGMRPDGSHFVHCDGIEFDGPYTGSVLAVVKEVTTRTLRARATANAAVTDTDRVLKTLEHHG